MNTVRRALALVLAGLAAVLVVTTSLAANGRPAPVPVLRVPGGTDWGYPQPFAYSRGPGLRNVLFVFDTLLWKDSTGSVIPWLAQKWRRSPDGFEYVFRLNPRAKWQDGEAVTSADVAFTFNYLISGPGSRATGLVNSLNVIKAIATPDAQTVVFRLNQRFAPFPITIAGRVPIIPQHIWKDVKDPVRFTGPQSLVGSGPYRLDRYDSATGAYRFVANPSFYLGVPVVRAIEFVPESNDMLALQQGIIDAGANPFEAGAPASALDAFTKNPRFGVLRGEGEWNRSLYFNMTKGFPFDKTAFRQAVAYAINRPDLVKRVLLGQGTPGSMGIIAPGSRWFAKGLPTYSFSPAKAKSMLTDVGLVDRDGDGWRDLPSGQPFKPQLITSTFQNPATAEIVTGQLRDVGLNVQLVSLDRASADAATAAGNYQMALLGFGGLGGDPDFVRLQLASNVRSRSFTRVFGYNNPRFDELASAQLVTVRASTRAKFVDEMQRILAQDVPVIQLYTIDRLWFFRKSVFSGWYYTPGGIFGGNPETYNKQAFVMGGKVGA
ncbi:ABC-type dipeptide transport system periplasmic component [Gaiella occulta]|uniref:ABC-type dipeptide transport system periplasmic component n=1 Tax=Gaiella occulta TaxID=1002870 RepID=A0A7M2Z091_9ACTN|nr:ABC transporter substrate-binding protein [Gaiella occulta]RDI75828.1 ABC-type dipeptide transport system periplasmic component [Gaiella occulta]